MTTISEITKILKALQGKLAGNYNVKNIGVFGSYARGEQTPESDVDIVVEFNAPIGMEFIELADELEKELKMKVDLVSRKAIRQRMWLIIEKEVIYV